MDQKIRKNLANRSWEETFWKQLTALPVIKSFSYNFPDTKDYQEHNVEIKADGLPAGAYAIIASPDKEFRTNNNPIALQYFYVSDIAYVNSSNKYYLLNRRNGDPLASAKIDIWQEKYNNTTRLNDLIQLSSYTTDANGFF